jgi:hypothetical protein
MKLFLILTCLLASTFFFCACENSTLSGTPTAAKAAKSFHLKKQNGQEAIISVTIPAGNFAAQRFPDVYIKQYITGYLAAWNRAISNRRLKFQPRDGKFRSPTSQANFNLYTDEQFDLQANQSAIAAGTTRDASSNAASGQAVIDWTNAGATGTEDGAKAAQQDCIQNLRSLEK